MVFREVSVIEVREMLRAWLAGKGLRKVAGQAGVDRKTARNYVNAALAAGLVRDGGEEQLTDELVGLVVAAVRPARPQGHGAGWEVLEGQHAQIVEWVGKDLTVVKIGDLLARRACGGAPYVAPVLRGAHRLPWPLRAGDGARRRRGAGRGVPARFRPNGLDFRLGDRAAPGGARVDLHRGVFAAHVRVVDIRDHVGGDRRRLRGGVAVLRRRVQGPRPG